MTSIYSKQKPIRLFVCEFITAGGLYRDALPQNLACEGKMMRDALLIELAQLDWVEVFQTYDVRTPPDSQLICGVKANNHEVLEHEDIWEVWQAQIALTDAVWLIAPETEGVLLKLTQMAEHAGKLILGCNANAVALTSSKYGTFQTLQRAGIAAVPTYKRADFLVEIAEAYSTCRWVVKPDDGVSGENSIIFEDKPALMSWLQTNTREDTRVIQPFVEGLSASISMLCHDGEAYLLSCNRQLVEEKDCRFVFRGVEINSMAYLWQSFAVIARQIGQAISGLNGYVGVDVMVKGDDISVIEINPRLTTSYVGLSQATGINIAAITLDLLCKGYHEDILHIQRNRVDVNVE